MVDIECNANEEEEVNNDDDKDGYSLYKEGDHDSIGRISWKPPHNNISSSSIQGFLHWNENVNDNDKMEFIGTGMYDLMVRNKYP